MGISIEEAKDFIRQSEEGRKDWMAWADRSWREIKKKSQDGRLWSTAPNSKKGTGKFPIWNSTLKIRQPIIFSRTPTPVGEDTTQDGMDNLGATAALLKERLAESLIRDADFFDEMCFSRDDFLIANLGTGRVYYGCEDIKEKVKIRITPQKDPVTGDVIFFDENGQQIVTDDIGQDDDGFFYESDQVVDVRDERVWYEHHFYKDFYPEPLAHKWGHVRRVAFAKHYSREAFKETFGARALLTVPEPDPEKERMKRKNIKVFELWDDYTNEVVWFAENGSDFIKPKKLTEKYEGDDEEQEVRNGLYGLRKFFPCTKPLLINQPTDEFYPVIEFYQLTDLIEDIHRLFSRMIAVTKAIRARVLFDSTITGLQAALNEATDGDAFGVTNLSQALSKAGGTLDGVVQYIPIEKLIQSLEQLYTAFDMRLNAFYQLTGTSDLLRGQTDTVERTYGEQQMKEKYALNQIAQFQWKMQEYVCDNINLMCEVALKNFSDESLDKHIVPRTLPADHQQRYIAALELLKSDDGRFRVSLETDSTIALNEEFNKQAAIEMVNALTAALEKTAATATNNPALAVPELHAMKFLVQSFRQGKVFQAELTQAIDEVIESTKNAQPQYNKDAEMAQIKREEMQMNMALQQYKMQSDAQIKMAEFNQKEAILAVQFQLEQMKAGQKNQEAAAKIELGYQQLFADMQKVQAELILQRDKLAAEAQAGQSSAETEKLRLLLDAQIAAYDQQLNEQKQRMEETLGMLDLQERVATEQRLREEHFLNKEHSKIDMVAKVAEISQMGKEEKGKEPQQPKSEKKLRFKKDKEGRIQSFEASARQG